MAETWNFDISGLNLWTNPAKTDCSGWPAILSFKIVKGTSNTIDVVKSTISSTDFTGSNWVGSILTNDEVKTYAQGTGTGTNTDNGGAWDSYLSQGFTNSLFNVLFRLQKISNQDISGVFEIAGFDGANWVSQGWTSTPPNLNYARTDGYTNFEPLTSDDHGTLVPIIFYNVVQAVTSNTCFAAGTPVNTDQGTVPIEELDHQFHTINNQPIVAVTKITSTDSYLIHIPKDLLGPNIPSQDTTISQLHKVLYNGVMTRAKELPGITKLAYNGQPLYNVLLDSYNKMTVNNLTVETLHPQANVAVLYKHITTNNLTDVERIKLINAFNTRIELTDGLRKAFFENIVLIIMLDILSKPEPSVKVTPYSVLRAFVPQCCLLACTEVKYPLRGT